MRCIGKTKNGERCLREATDSTKRKCWQHGGKKPHVSASTTSKSSASPNAKLTSLEVEQKETKIDVPFTRLLDMKKSRQMPYRETRGEVRLNIHIGQRKLLLTEIEFLTLHGDLSDLVVYAGAAHGTHIKYLSELFPEHYFDLYDPGRFIVKESDRITIFNGYFLDENAKSYQGEPTLLISDIRSVQKQNTATGEISDEWEGEIIQNMEMQAKWAQIMQPKMIMFKFRLPYNPGATKYLSGQIYWQAWAPQASTETRLITNQYQKTETYDHDTYNDICFRFNRITRSQWYEHDIPLDQVPGLDHCYDCRTEIHILNEYLKKYHSDRLTTQKARNQEIVKMMNRITDELGKSARLNQPPHGLHPELKDREEKKMLVGAEALKYQKKYTQKKTKLKKKTKFRA